MFLIAYLLIFSFSLINCSDSSSTAAAAAAPVSILSLPEEEKMKYIRVIHRTIADIGDFLGKDHHTGIMLSIYDSKIFSNKHFHTPNLDQNVYVRSGYKILTGRTQIDRGLLFCTYTGGVDQKSKDYGLITPWGMIKIFSQKDSAAAKKFGPEKFENKLFNILRKNLNIEFDLKDYLPSTQVNFWESQKKTIHEIYTEGDTTFDVIISKKDGTPESKKVDLDEIHTYFGRKDVRVTPIAESCRDAAGNPIKLVLPAYYHIGLKSETSLPKPSFRYLGNYSQEDVETWNQDFRDIMTKYKAGLKIKRFLQTHTASHKKARIAPAGGAGGGSGEVTE